MSPILSPPALYRPVVLSAAAIWKIPHGQIYESTQTTNQLYFALANIEGTAPITGIQVNMGGTTNGNVIVALYDSGGAKVAESSSTAVTAGNAFQTIAFTASYTPSPGQFFLAVIPSAGIQTFINCHNGSPSNNAAQGAFSVPATITVPAATARAGYTPIMSTY